MQQNIEIENQSIRLIIGNSFWLFHEKQHILIVSEALD